MAEEKLEELIKCFLWTPVPVNIGDVFPLQDEEGEHLAGQPPSESKDLEGAMEGVIQSDAKRSEPILHSIMIPMPNVGQHDLDTEETDHLDELFAGLLTPESTPPPP